MPSKAQEKPEKAEYIAGLARGLEVIRAFDHDTPEMTLSEVALKTNLAPATARRCLLTLEELGYVRRIGKRFVLSVRILSLAASYLSSMNLKEIAQPILEDLRATFDDASSLTVLDGLHVVYIAHAPTTRELRMRQSVGSRLPAHATSTGLVLLAALDPVSQKAYLAKAPFARFTAKTPTTAAELRKIFADVAKQQYAITEDTLEYGSMAVAVPIRNAAGQAIAAINCSCDSTRGQDKEALKLRLPFLQKASSQIANALERFPALAHSVAGDR